MLVVLFLAVFSGSVFAQSNADHNGLGDLLVNWKTDCAPRGCLMQTEVLRGDSGTYNQYPEAGSAAAHGALCSSTEANTVSTGPMKGRFTNFFSDFFRDTSHRQAAVIVHENIHRATGWSDSNCSTCSRITG